MCVNKFLKGQGGEFSLQKISTFVNANMWKVSWTEEDMICLPIICILGRA